MDVRQTRLSPRQWEILALKAMGYTTPTAAHALGIHTDGVKSVSVNLLLKMGSSNMTHAVYLATKAGII